MTAYTFIDQDTIAQVEVDDGAAPTLSPTALHQATGWEVKPEGFCKGDVCVPAGEAVAADGAVDLAGFAKLMGRPLVIDRAEKALSLGAAARDRGGALQSLEAPDFTLPDLDANLHSLSDYRGKKILLAAYASW